MLVSLDYAGIEAVHVGWYSGDPNYIRLAKQGVHAYVASHVAYQEKKISEPAQLSWSDSDLSRFLQDIKKRFKEIYEKSKRCVHGTNYGLTVYGMADYYPETFPKRSDAERVQNIYFEVCPKLKPYQGGLRRLAHFRKMLGGPLVDFEGSPTARYWKMMEGLHDPDPRNSRTQLSHPFGYRAEFFGVLQYRKVKGVWKEYLGEDAKKVVAWPTQSSAAGCLTESCLLLFDPERAGDYIGDLYYGQSPLRAVIHDELLMEVPAGAVDRLLERAVPVMSRAIRQMPMPAEWGLGDYLTIGVSAKVGRNWAPASEENPDGMKTIGIEHLSSDVWREEEEDDEEAA